MSNRQTAAYLETRLRGLIARCDNPLEALAMIVTNEATREQETNAELGRIVRLLVTITEDITTERRAARELALAELADVVLERGEGVL